MIHNGLTNRRVLSLYFYKILKFESCYYFKVSGFTTDDFSVIKVFKWDIDHRASIG